MAAMLVQNQLCLFNCNSQYHPSAFSKSAISPTSSPESLLLPGALFGAANSARNPIRMKKAVRLVEEPSRWPRFRYGDNSIVTNVAGNRTPMLVGRRGLVTQMEGVRWVQGEVGSSRRVTVVKATGNKQVVVMVDPVEAKRLAAAEMKAIQARAKRKRRTEIEAINGGWAIIGLTVGIIIDGYTGKSILLQIAGYLDAVADLLAPLTSSLEQ